MAQQSKTEESNAEKTEPSAEETKTETTKNDIVGTLQSRLKAILSSTRNTVVIGVVASVVAVYVLGGLLFSAHFLPRTTINGSNASLRSAAAVADDAQSKSEGFVANVTGNGIDLAIEAYEVDLSFDREAYERAAQALMPGWQWPLKLFAERDFTISDGIYADQDALANILSPLVEEANTDGIPSAPATIEYDEQAREFVGVEEQMGSLVDFDLTLDAITRGIETLQEQIVLGPSELVQPTLSINDSRFAAAVQRANDTSDLALSLYVEGEKVANTNTRLMRSWIVLDDDYQVTGDLDAITAWAQTDLSSQVDTIGTMRTYTRPDDGKVIQVFGGTYGWNVDGEALAQVIKQRIEDDSSEGIDIPMKSMGINYVHGAQDWGGLYVDVDLTEQCARMYDEQSNLIWISECVTGNLSEAQDTITGAFSLEDKQSPAVLVGLDNDMDGEPDYESDVDYWMPFFGGYGLHDALWRDSFGGDEHLYNGSHGCVNLPYYAAQQLYDLISIGDPVIVHW